MGPRRAGITPEMALALLSTSSQHQINLQKAIQYARHIHEGTWDSSMDAQQPIKTHRIRGSLQNGHHRLLAIVLTGTPMCMVVDGPLMRVGRF